MFLYAKQIDCKEIGSLKKQQIEFHYNEQLTQSTTEVAAFRKLTAAWKYANSIIWHFMKEIKQINFSLQFQE